ncbi:hypothetical protein BaRGS_00019115 [Batillaria attramentaria]|uniref:Uncharacterized protein n=1 Tax=Batillaria attramentaria TaxID=370345 RepID=A0ABD0KR17_9CAEN
MYIVDMAKSGEKKKQNGTRRTVTQSLSSPLSSATGKAHMHPQNLSEDSNAYKQAFCNSASCALHGAAGWTEVDERLLGAVVVCESWYPGHVTVCFVVCTYTRLQQQEEWKGRRRYVSLLSNSQEEFKFHERQVDANLNDNASSFFGRRKADNGTCTMYANTQSFLASTIMQCTCTVEFDMTCAVPAGERRQFTPHYTVIALSSDVIRVDCQFKTGNLL